MRTNLFILFLNHDYTEEDEQLFNEELIPKENSKNKFPIYLCASPM
jgi:hypothetical protein